MAVFLLILKIIGISLLSVIGLVVLLLCLPIFVYIRLDDELTVDIRVLLIKFKILPANEPKKENGFFGRLWKRITGGGKKQENDGTSEKEESKFKALFGARGVTGAVSFLWEVLKLVYCRFVKILRSVVVSKFDLDLEITGDDASDTALRYGKLCGVIYPSLSLIFQNVRKYKHTINMRPDFDENLEYDRVYLNTTLRVYPIIILVQLIALLFELIVSEVKRKVSENLSEANVKSN